jgi:hypothetical protein
VNRGEGLPEILESFTASMDLKPLLLLHSAGLYCMRDFTSNAQDPLEIGIVKNTPIETGTTVSVLWPLMEGLGQKDLFNV